MSELTDKMKVLMDAVDDDDVHLFDQDETVEINAGDTMKPATFRLPDVLREALDIASTESIGKSAIVRKAIIEFLIDNNPEAIVEAKQRFDKEEISKSSSTYDPDNSKSNDIDDSETTTGSEPVSQP